MVNPTRPITVCFRCNSHDAVQRVRKIISSGREQIIDYCVRCECNAGKTHIIGRAEAGDIESMPILTDMTKDAPICEVCSSSGTELHHWAPRHVFGWDCEKWPKAWLCPNCHEEWHKRVEGDRRWQKRQL